MKTIFIIMASLFLGINASVLPRAHATETGEQIMTGATAGVGLGLTGVAISSGILPQILSVGTYAVAISASIALLVGIVENWDRIKRALSPAEKAALVRFVNDGQQAYILSGELDPVLDQCVKNILLNKEALKAPNMTEADALELLVEQINTHLK